MAPPAPINMLSFWTSYLRSASVICRPKERKKQWGLVRPANVSFLVSMTGASSEVKTQGSQTGPCPQISGGHLDRSMHRDYSWKPHCQIQEASWLIASLMIGLPFVSSLDSPSGNSPVCSKRSPIELKKQWPTYVWPVITTNSFLGLFGFFYSQFFYCLYLPSHTMYQSIHPVISLHSQSRSIMAYGSMQHPSVSGWDPSSQFLRTMPGPLPCVPPHQ